MSALLSIADLKMTFGAFTLGPISLDLARGDYLVLLGPSGCGKTSLVRAIAGLERLRESDDADGGRLVLDGVDITRLAPHKRHLGYVAQKTDLFPHLDVAGNIAFGLRYASGCADDKRKRRDRIVDLLGVEHLLARDTATLSGGESKRVGLARCLVLAPKVLLLDEPLSMLDPNARADMLDILMMIHDELNTAAVHVTHDREEAWTLGGRCAVMRDGRIEQDGTVAGLFRRPKTRFVARFLGGANVLDARFERRGAQSVAILEWGELPIEGPAPAERGAIQIRPDTLAPAADGRISGTLRAIRDRGIYAEVLLVLHSGVEIRAHIVHSEAAGVRVGDTIRLRLTQPPHPIVE